MTRSPAAHRLVTKKARQERAWRRQTRRNYRQRYMLGWDGSSDDIALTAAYEREFHSSRYPIYVVGTTPESWLSPPRLRSVGTMPAEYRRLVERAEAPHTKAETADTEEA